MLNWGGSWRSLNTGVGGSRLGRIRRGRTPERRGFPAAPQPPAFRFRCPLPSSNPPLKMLWRCPCGGRARPLRRAGQCQLPGGQSGRNELGEVGAASGPFQVLRGAAEAADLFYSTLPCSVSPSVPHAFPFSVFGQAPSTKIYSCLTAQKPWSPYHRTLARRPEGQPGVGHSQADLSSMGASA